LKNKLTLNLSIEKYSPKSFPYFKFRIRIFRIVEINLLILVDCFSFFGVGFGVFQSPALKKENVSG
jgi:hypothetical protein